MHEHNIKFHSCAVVKIKREIERKETGEKNERNDKG